MTMSICRTNCSSIVPINKKGDCIFTSNFREVNNLGTEINIVKLDRDRR